MERKAAFICVRSFRQWLIKTHAQRQCGNFSSAPLLAKFGGSFQRDAFETIATRRNYWRIPLFAWSDFSNCLLSKLRSSAFGDPIMWRSSKTNVLIDVFCLPQQLGLCLGMFGLVVSLVVSVNVWTDTHYCEMRLIESVCWQATTIGVNKEGPGLPSPQGIQELNIGVFYFNISRSNSDTY